MTIDDCISIAKEYNDIDKRILFIKIGESYKNHMSNQKLTDKDKFFLGLRYSEFFSLGDSNEDYYLAEVQRNIILNMMGITHEYINSGCQLYCGLH